MPVTFTVNRYGSVYEFVSGIDEVNGKHVQAVEKDLVIREYSATKLKTPLDSNVQITINGKPVSAAVVNAEEKHENGGWYEYTYTVAASSFAEDGYYKLEVSSTDSENGKGSGTAMYADMGLAFFKDGTNPQRLRPLVCTARSVLGQHRRRSGTHRPDRLPHQQKEKDCQG